MANKVIMVSQTGKGVIRHFGIKGMKWDEKKIKKRTEKLEKQVTKTVKKFDKGRKISDEKLEDLAKDIRKQKADVDKKIKKAEKFLEKAKKADAKNIINRFNKDPNKKAAVQNYLKSLKTSSTTLAELRTQMMDVRMSNAQKKNNDN